MRASLSLFLSVSPPPLSRLVTLLSLSRLCALSLNLLLSSSCLPCLLSLSIVLTAVCRYATVQFIIQNFAKTLFLANNSYSLLLGSLLLLHCGCVNGIIRGKATTLFYLLMKVRSYSWTVFGKD